MALYFRELQGIHRVLKGSERRLAFVGCLPTKARAWHSCRMASKGWGEGSYSRNNACLLFVSKQQQKSWCKPLVAVTLNTGGRDVTMCMHAYLLLLADIIDTKVHLLIIIAARWCGMPDYS